MVNIEVRLTIFFGAKDGEFSLIKSCLNLCNFMDCSTPGLPVHHQLPEFTQTHVHWVEDAIQPSHPLLSLSPPTFYLSQHQGLFKWVSISHQVVKELEHQFQCQSFEWICRTDFLQDTLVWSPCCLRDSQESSPNHSSKASFLPCSTFFIVQLSHPYMITRKTIALTRWTFVGQVMQKVQKGKMLVWIGLTNRKKRRELKAKENRKDIPICNPEFQRIGRRGMKAFLSDQYKEIEENNRLGKTRDLLKRIRYQGKFSCKMGTIKDQVWT